MQTFQSIISVLPAIFLSFVATSMVDIFGGGSKGWAITAFIVAVISCKCFVVCGCSKRAAGGRTGNRKCSRCESPLAKGLFSKAAAQSGTHIGKDTYCPQISLKEAEAKGVTYLTGIQADSVEDLRKMSTEEIFAGSWGFLPFRDGVVWPEIHFCEIIHRQQNIPYSDIIKRVIEYIYNNIYSMIYENDIAYALSLNPSYLSKIFKDETGIHLKEYIQQAKIKEAKNLIRYSDMSLTEIAAQLGYSDLSHFTKVCKTYAGCTPKQLKEQVHRKEPDHAPTSIITLATCDRRVFGKKWAVPCCGREDRRITQRAAGREHDSGVRGDFCEAKLGISPRKLL